MEETVTWETSEDVARRGGGGGGGGGATGVRGSPKLMGGGAGLC